jgi:inner membrane protein
LTVYGTQIALPFSDQPVGVGSIFIIDPLYTLPLLLGAGWALATRGSPRGMKANAVGLALSTCYLAWGLAAQQHVGRIAHQSLAAQGIAAERVLVTPTAFNSVLWRVVAVAGDAYYEGFYSLFDATPRLGFDRFARGNALADELRGHDGVQRIRRFSKGFYQLRQDGARVLISDLRMGQEPVYIFTFAVAERRSAAVALAANEQVGARLDLQRGLPWLWRRAWGDDIPPPR